MVSVAEARGCPVNDADGSSQLQWIHRRAHISQAGDTSVEIQFKSVKVAVQQRE